MFSCSVLKPIPSTWLQLISVCLSKGMSNESVLFRFAAAFLLLGVLTPPPSPFPFSSNRCKEKCYVSANLPIIYMVTYGNSEQQLRGLLAFFLL